MSENRLAFVPSHRKISNTRYIWPVFSSFKDIIYLFLTNMRNIRKIRKIFRIFIFLALIWLLPSILSKYQLFFKFLWRFHCTEKFCDLPTLDCNITARWIFLEISQFLFFFFFFLPWVVFPNWRNMAYLIFFNLCDVHYWVLYNCKLLYIKRPFLKNTVKMVYRDRAIHT